LGEIEDQFPLLIRDVDMDELEGDRNLVFERFGEPDGVLGGEESGADGPGE